MELAMQVLGFNFGEDSGGVRGFNFTERVRKVLSMSREEAMDLGHEYVGTEHILLGLTRDEGVASTVLANLGIDADALRNRVLEIVRRGTKEPGVADLPYTSRAKKTLELAMAEAKRLHHAYVGTEHLLLGLLAEEKGIAAQVLIDAGCTLERARAETLVTLGAAPEERVQRADEAPRTRHTTRGGFDHLSSTPNRLSARALAIASGANIDAVKRGSRAVRAEHLLHALLEHGDGSAAVVLQHLGADRSKLLAEFNAQREPDVGGGGPETQVDDTELLTYLGLAEMERERSDAPYVATHHLMLALMNSAEGNALFAGTGITPERVRQEAARISG
jgi:ATP-dependent Clp protease ATP-binding subunit ClpA